jgi:hypothetical protein
MNVLGTYISCQQTSSRLDSRPKAPRKRIVVLSLLKVDLQGSPLLSTSTSHVYSSRTEASSSFFYAPWCFSTCRKTNSEIQFRHITRIAVGASSPKVLVPGRWKSSPRRQLGDRRKIPHVGLIACKSEFFRPSDQHHGRSIGPHNISFEKP